eukprot:gene36788-30432_t
MSRSGALVLDSVEEWDISRMDHTILTWSKPFKGDRTPDGTWVRRGFQGFSASWTWNEKNQQDQFRYKAWYSDCPYHTIIQIIVIRHSSPGPQSPSDSPSDSDKDSLDI